ncbi:MAG: cardiolipin synthase [Pseudomonadota bacterium]
MIWNHTIPWGYILTAALTMGGYLLAFFLIPRILLDRRNPEATLAWILIIIFLPYLGAAAFFLLARPRLKRRTRKRWRYRNALQVSLEKLPGAPAPDARRLIGPREGRDIARLAGAVAETPLLPGNAMEVFIDGQKAYAAMEEALSNATRHIHLMSYIFRPDYTGTRFRDILTEKAWRGVKVKLLVDAFGGRHISASFIRPLLREGGELAFFSPMLPRLSRWRPNLRNHRKILVVDGSIGFTGGLNIGNEYQGRTARLAPWRDTHLRVEGPAVRSLQEIFIEDWLYAANEDLAEIDYFPDTPAAGPELVQVIASGPDCGDKAIHRVFFTAITEARRKIYITTPYFVPDPGMLLALKAASWRGLDVRVLLPGASDMPLVQWAGRSYYQELLEAGVTLYEHRPGVLHAKTMVVDGNWSTVGSANMDIRSFQLNFEVNVLVWGTAFAECMENIFLKDLENSRLLSLPDIEKRSLPVRMVEGVARVLSPVL